MVKKNAKFSERSFLNFSGAIMKPYSISGIAARLAALLTLMMLTIGLNVSAYAQTSAPERDTSASQEAGDVDIDSCGGPTGIPCREGLVCVDNPQDNCDPRKSDVKCFGTCKKTAGEDELILKPK